MFANTHRSEFPEHAEHAASLERAGYYSEAAFAWTVASQHARKPENRHWAECRSMFCETWKCRYQQGKAA